MKRGIPFQILVVLIVFLFACKKKDSSDSGTPTTPGLNDLSKLENFNFILGTHAISKSYQFTTENKLVEQAKKVREMGSNILKISMGPNSTDIYDITEATKSTRVLDLFTRNAPYRTVMDMDFKYIFMWVHTMTGIDWKNGISAANEQILYDEIYNFASHLLTRYNNSGKTFLIGNWEGDWILLPSYDRTQTPPAAFIANMIKWYQIRQKAIDDAKRASASTNVFVYHYAEVNLALKGMQGQPCVAESVLPNVDVDLVSYSSYEAIKDKTYAQKKTELTNIFNYLETKLKPRTGLPFSRRVFIGEYGYQANASNATSMQKQVTETKEIMKISLELNLPFALHWQMYNNEYENGVSKQMSLINESGVKMPLYFTHQNFYKKMNNYLITYKADNNNSLPSTEDFRKKALEILNTL